MTTNADRARGNHMTGRNDGRFARFLVMGVLAAFLSFLGLTVAAGQLDSSGAGAGITVSQQDAARQTERVVPHVRTRSS